MDWILVDKRTLFGKEIHKSIQFAWAEQISHLRTGF